ncbi:Ribonuclease/ribotoxin [Armillaria novae-zelandiae]|uniref:Ribonuclease/ribotoxin n=1 Tax=Armillaria novae-zelandiae TaxID=153914 RepID=A0AA39PHY8_9AGAR|nr:Ribonuclease/ribotoxin [Armillaria novae-zelandiae]
MIAAANGSPVCGYSPTNNACVELSSVSSASPPSLKLARITADCKPTSSQQGSQHTSDAPKTTDAARNTETKEGHNEKSAGEDTTVTSRHELPDTVTCGANIYSRTDIQAAIKTGQALIKKPIVITKQKGKGRRKQQKVYPHEYKNHEGLTTAPGCVKPYYEFPILTNGIFGAGYNSPSSKTSSKTDPKTSPKIDPKTDRVVFDPSGNYCAVMTHTGAPQKNEFVSCIEPESSAATPSSNNGPIESGV